MTAKYNTPHLMVPADHLNGTGEDQLVAHLGEVRGAVRKLKERMQERAPHSRDYYVLSEDAFGYAQLDHVARLRVLDRIDRELTEQAGAVRMHVAREMPSERGTFARQKLLAADLVRIELGQTDLFSLVFLCKLSDEHSERFGWVECYGLRMTELLHFDLVEECVEGRGLQYRVTPLGRLVVEVAMRNALGKDGL